MTSAPAFVDFETRSRADLTEVGPRRGEGRKRGRMSDRPHNMAARIGHWPACKACGLIALRNPASRAALASACPGPRDQRLAGDAANALWARLRREGWR